jgi:hypothetical protein
MDSNIDKGKKKVKIRIKDTVFNKDNQREVRSGSAATLTRNKKGVLEAHRDENFAGINEQTMREDREVKQRLKEGDSHFSGVSAPRVGGDIEPTVQAKGTSNKKLMIKSIKNVKQNSASPQAKQAAIRMLRRGN